jgi:hypothetical protein
MPIHFRASNLVSSCAAISVLGEYIIHLLPRGFSRSARSLECGGSTSPTAMLTRAAEFARGPDNPQL